MCFCHTDNNNNLYLESRVLVTHTMTVFLESRVLLASPSSSYVRVFVTPVDNVTVSTTTVLGSRVMASKNG